MSIFQLLGWDRIGPYGLISTLLAFLFFVLVFSLIVRELITWYWKINRIVKLLEKIDQNTSKSIQPNEVKMEQPKPQEESHGIEKVGP